MNIKIKRLHPNAVIPKYSKQGDAGMDLTITTMEWSKVRDHITYSFGIAIEIPEGHVGLIFPRSSIYKTNQMLTISVGVIDSGYRGEIKAVMTHDADLRYNVGDRAAQIMIIPYPQVTFEEVEELSDSERGTAGYGSTGK